MKPDNRMAALGPLAVCAGVVAAYLFLAWISTPTAVAAAPGATGGIDKINRTVIWICALIPVSLFLWSHIAFAKQLREGPKSLVG